MSAKTDIWNVLEIDKTNDKTAIKKAYLKKLKITNPEDNPEDFMRLRDAYEAAISICDYNYDSDYYYEYEENYTDTEDYYEETLSPEEMIIREKLDSWSSQVEEVYNNLEKRFDIKCWHELLYDNLPMCIQYYHMCRAALNEKLIYPISQSYRFIPDNITRLINDFFSYSGGDVERTMQGNNWLRLLNKKLKLNENIRFDLFDISVLLTVPDGSSMTTRLDKFCHNYNLMIVKLMKNVGNSDKISYKISNELLNCVSEYEEEGEDVFYLPFEVMKLNNSFNDMTEDEIKNSIEELEAEAWNRLSGNVLNRGKEKELKNSISMEISLLNVEYLIYKNNIREAVRILDELYQKVSVKDFMYLYRLSGALNKAGKHYEEYRCIYILAYLNPSPEIFDMLNKIRNNIITQYENAEKNNKPYTNIQMCRMYLHNDEVFKAQAIIRSIRGRKSFKYYAASYMAAVEADYYKFFYTPIFHHFVWFPICM